MVGNRLIGDQMNDEDVLCFQEKLADLLKVARGQSVETRRVVQLYLDEGYRLGLVAEELIDFLRLCSKRA